MEKEVWHFERDIQVVDRYDVLVAGGGPAGIAAATAAARTGASVLLIEQTGGLGGMSTTGLVPNFCRMTDGVRILVGGIGKEIVKRLRTRNGTGPDDHPDNWNSIPLNPEKLKLVYDEMVTEAGVSLRLYTSLVDVICEDDKVTGVVLSGKTGLFAIFGKIFIDTTGDAMLSWLAEAPCKLGDENGNTQGPTLCSVFANVEWESYRKFLRETGQGHSLEKTLNKAIEEGAFTIPDLHMPGVRRTGLTFVGANVGHVYGINGVDELQLTEGMLQGRRMVQEYLRFYRKYVPGFAEAELVTTAALLGVRETRRIIGEYVLNVEDFLAQRSFEDEIGRYNYPVDIHRSTPPSREEYEAFLREFKRELRYEKGESYGIPFRSLVPKKLANVLVAGRCISTDRKMQGSTRVMPCCFITGQAAGTAAAIRSQKNIDIRSLNTNTLRTQLKRDGAYLP